ncbi:uncharacterized protein LOC131598084 [Vicia villosa]|uniref:uncharacterized protein LOC131598084 n=1 Tax=Vicia villosa TaxID=3911 RepID=UPI00273BB543|nr:uncharacterized protein LOC131598084 [Vicia villosa]
MYFIPQINTDGVNVDGFMSERQVPQFSTQVGIENTTVEKDQRCSVKRKTREVFTREENILLMQSWLNVSKDPIVGVDQKAEGFWLRITDNYNQYCGQLREKLQGQLKYRWHRINGLVQKFVGCYKQAVHGKKSGQSEKDILANAHAFFLQDEGIAFNLEYAWRLLKDEPKWMRASTENSSKRTKNSVSGAHSSSYEYNSSSPMERPMGQQVEKRKSKAKEKANASESPSNVVQDTWNKILATMERLAQCKEDEMEFKAMQLLSKDTSTMNDSQRDIHEKYYSSDKLFWNLIEEEFMDNTDEELLKSMLEKEHQSGSSSRPKKRMVIDRSREERHNPALGAHDEYFQMRVDATGKMGLSPLQKCTSAIRMLAYGSPADCVDKYVRIGESTSVECLERFVRGVNVVFGAEYLRKPNNTDVEHLLQMGELRRFPGSKNDINVINQSNVFNDILEGHAPTMNYTINRTSYNMGYYLADDIYPEWATFVKNII